MSGKCSLVVVGLLPFLVAAGPIGGRGSGAGVVSPDHRRTSSDRVASRTDSAGTDEAQAPRDKLGLAIPADTGIQDACWSPDGSRIATAEEDGAVRIRDATTGDVLQACRGHKPITIKSLSRPYRAVMSVLWNHGALGLVSLGVDGAVRFWDPDRGTQRRNSIAAAPPTGRSGLLKTSTDGNWLMWCDEHGNHRQRLSDHKTNVVTGFVTEADLSPDGKSLAVVRNWAPAIEVINGTGKPLLLKGHGTGIAVPSTIPSVKPIRHGVCALQWRPDGKRLASGGHDGSVRIWDPSTGQAVRVFKTGGHAVSAVAWHPAGRLVAGGDDGGTVHVWAIATGREVGRLKVTPGVIGLCWSPNGRRLLGRVGFEYSGCRELRVWEWPSDAEEVRW